MMRLDIVSNDRPQNENSGMFLHILINHLSLLLFMLFLTIKLQLDINISWILVFIPLFVLDFYSLHVKLQEFRERRLGNDRNFSYLSGSEAAEIIGSGISKLFICLDLSGYTSSHVPIVILALSFLLSVLLSAIVRCTVHSIVDPSPSRKQRIFNSIILGVLHFILRGLQPLIIVLQIDGYIRQPWNAVMLLAWALVAVGMAIMGVMIVFTPCVHLCIRASLRGVTVRLMYASLALVSVMTICCTLFLLRLCRRLDYEYGLPSGMRYPLIIVLSPLFTLYVLLLVLHPVVIRYSFEYQRALQAALLQSTQSNHPPMELEKLAVDTYLIQVSSTRFALCDETSAELCRLHYQSTKTMTMTVATTLSPNPPPNRDTNTDMQSVIHLVGGVSGEGDAVGVVAGTDVAAAAPFTSSPHSTCHRHDDDEDEEQKRGRESFDDGNNNNNNNNNSDNYMDDAYKSNTAIVKQTEGNKLAISALVSSIAVNGDNKDNDNGPRRSLPSPAPSLSPPQMLRQRMSSLPTLSVPARQPSSPPPPTAILGRTNSRLVGFDVGLGLGLDAGADIVQGMLMQRQSSAVACDLPINLSSPPASKPPLVKMISFTEDQCAVCFASAPDTCVMNCGHGGLCMTCALEVARRAPHLCPICRGEITLVLRITRPSFPIGDGRLGCISEEGYRLVAAHPSSNRAIDNEDDDDGDRRRDVDNSSNV